MDFTFGLADRQSSLMTRVLVPGGGGGGGRGRRRTPVKCQMKIQHNNIKSNNIGKQFTSKIWVKRPSLEPLSCVACSPKEMRKTCIMNKENSAEYIV